MKYGAKSIEKSKKPQCKQAKPPPKSVALPCEHPRRMRSFPFATILLQRLIGISVVRDTFGDYLPYAG